MSTLNFLPGSIPSSATPRFSATGVPYFSSSSLRLVSALSHKNPEVIVINWWVESVRKFQFVSVFCVHYLNILVFFVGEFGNFREKSRIPQHVFSGMKEMNMAVRHAEKQIPPGPHWKFCYKTIRNDFTIIALILHQFDLDLRNAVSYLKGY